MLKAQNAFHSVSLFAYPRGFRHQGSVFSYTSIPVSYVSSSPYVRLSIGVFTSITTMDHFPAPPGASHAHRGPTVVILESILLSICILVVGFRTWTRAFQRRNFGLDDLFILLALLFLIGQGTVVLLGTSC